MVRIQHRCRELSIGFGRVRCAFEDIHRDLAHLAWGGDFPFIGRPRVMFSSCTAGKRPLVFRLERLDE